MSNFAIVFRSGKVKTAECRKHRELKDILPHPEISTHIFHSYTSMHFYHSHRKRNYVIVFLSDSRKYVLRMDAWIFPPTFFFPRFWLPEEPVRRIKKHKMLLVIDAFKIRQVFCVVIGFPRNRWGL